LQQNHQKSIIFHDELLKKNVLAHGMNNLGGRAAPNRITLSLYRIKSGEAVGLNGNKSSLYRISC